MNDLDIDRRYDALRSAPRVPSDPLDHFGRNSFGYDLGGPEGDGDIDDDSEDYGDGAPGKDLVVVALMAWAQLWQRYDRETAAAVFHIKPELLDGDEMEILPEHYHGIEPSDRDFSNCVQMLSSQRVHYVQPPKSPFVTPVVGAPRKFVEPTVAEIAALMNTSEAKVTKAVLEHNYMLLGEERDGSPTIEHDGE